MSNPLPESGEPSADQRQKLEEMEADPQLAAGLEDLAGSLARMAADKYRRLFPWAEMPDFDAFDSWLTQVGTDSVEFGFHTPDPLRTLSATGIRREERPASTPSSLGYH